MVRGGRQGVTQSPFLSHHTVCRVFRRTRPSLLVRRWSLLDNLRRHSAPRNALQPDARTKPPGRRSNRQRVSPQSLYRLRWEAPELQGDGGTRCHTQMAADAGTATATADAVRPTPTATWVVLIGLRSAMGSLSALARGVWPTDLSPTQVTRAGGALAGPGANRPRCYATHLWRVKALYRPVASDQSRASARGRGVSVHGPWKLTTPLSRRSWRRSAKLDIATLGGGTPPERAGEQPCSGRIRPSWSTLAWLG